MAESGVFLDYHGQPDFMVLDSLLLKLKKTREFKDLHITIRKRTYSIFVECVENIIRHSILKNSDDHSVLPYVSVRNENDRIIISAGNPIPLESRAKLIQKLNIINNMDVAELRKFHELIINREPVQGEYGAGLGFICMAFKSRNKLQYSFHPLNAGYLFFELQITLINKL